MIDLLAQLDLPGWASHFAVVMFRTVGLFIFVPILGSDLLPMRIRFVIAAVLAFAFLPFAPRLAVPPTDVVGWIIVGIRELGAGLGLGIAARVIFAAVETAAQLVSGQSGFSLASMVDPSSGDQSSAPNMFMNLLAVAVFLAADLHHIFILAIRKSYELLPPAISLPDAAALGAATSSLGMRLFTVAIELAAPAMIVAVGVDLVIVMAGKAMPQVPILIVGYPFKMAVGLIALAMLAVSTGAAIGWAGRTIASDGAALISTLAGAR